MIGNGIWVLSWLWHGAGSCHWLLLPCVQTADKMSYPPSSLATEGRRGESARLILARIFLHSIPSRELVSS
jgi:hypothetical protein